MHRQWIGLAAACLLVAASVGPVRSQSAPLRRAPIGTNLPRIDDWGTEFPFTDVFKASRDWFSGEQSPTRWVWADQRALDLDARGWVRSLQPGQVARTLMFWDLSRAPGA